MKNMLPGTQKAWSSLYVCYFGLEEPLVQTQVLPYIRQLANSGWEMHLLTFERSFQSVESRQEIARKLQQDGVSWVPLKYHERPTVPATLFDIANGVRVAKSIMRHHQIDIIHGRSHVATAIGALARWRTGTRLLFDIRGFFPEEYVDAGRWPENGVLYRWTKHVESRLYAACDGAVVLTEKAKQILRDAPSASGLRGKPVEVIPCCVDSSRFPVVTPQTRQQMRAQLGIDDHQPVQVYVGALDGWYLTDELAACMACAHELNPDTFSLVLTQSPRGILAERFRGFGMAQQSYMIERSDPQDIARYLSAADYAISMIKPCFSKQASSPTKIAEYLACGLPVLSNVGIGDLDELIKSQRIGVLLSDFSNRGYKESLLAIQRLLKDPEVAARCRGIARECFDLNTVGGPRYRSIYEQILKPINAAVSA